MDSKKYFPRWDSKKYAVIALGFMLLNLCVASFVIAQSGFWMKGDFHIHTTMSDGDETPAEIARNAFEKFDLDAIAVTDHGGLFFRVNDNFRRTDDRGIVFPIRNYDTLIAVYGKKFKNYSRSFEVVQKSYPEVVRLRDKYSNKLIIQGLEWDVPGHDHGDVGILSESGAAISDFNYLFDRSDTVPSWKSGVAKQNANVHLNALAALQYLQRNYPNKSYFIVNHPSRKLQYTIADMREFNDVTPTIAIGFEGLVGHQINPENRCKYDYELGDRIRYHSKTYGGADFILAKVGGVWDAMLGEGRRFWVFANSDFHRPNEDSWPGEFTKNYIWVKDSSYDALLDGMRKGKMYIVSGDLIRDLQFTAVANGTTIAMGESGAAVKGSTVTVTIGFKSLSKNYHGDSVSVDHIDLICGDMTGRILPESAQYHNPINASTKILKRFTMGKWKKDSDGYSYVTYSFGAERSQYFRVRGTNLPVGTEK